VNLKPVTLGADRIALTGDCIALRMTRAPGPSATTTICVMLLAPPPRRASDIHVLSDTPGRTPLPVEPDNPAQPVSPSKQASMKSIRSKTMGYDR
jgi:hypothetical protein